jgi:hypothetical protein
LTVVERVMMSVVEKKKMKFFHWTMRINQELA